MPALLTVAALWAIAQQNLLPNGGFEDLAPDKMPTQWTITGAGARVDLTVKHSGRASLRFHAAVPQEGNLRALSPPVAVSGTIRVTAWLKTSGVLPGRQSWNVAAVRLLMFDAAGKPIGKHWGHFDVAGQTGTRDWTRYQVTIRLYPEVKTIRIACLLDGGATGTAWFDDISVERVPPKPRQPCRLRVVMPQLPEKFPPPKKTWPDDVLVCRIVGNQIVRAGRPAFLLGAWSLQDDTWLCRVLGLDYTTLMMGDYAFFARKAKDGAFEIGWGDVPWIEGLIRDALNAGLMVRADMHGASERASHLRPVRENCPEIFVPHGHYANFCPHHPKGLDIYRAKFAAWIARTRKYPIWTYKVFNELSFMDYCAHNLAAFRAQMKKKYGAIEAANKAWGTNFASFDDVVPPERKTYGVMQSEGISINLWVDWLKFCEADNIKSLVAPAVKIHRQLDPGQVQGYRGVQAHCNLLFDYGASTIDPAAKARVGDYYSHECSSRFYRQVEGHTEVDELEDMLRFLLSYDIVRSVCPDKPIINDENYFTATSRLASPRAARQRAVANLTDRWRFHLDPRDEGLDAGWASANFDDSAWQQLSAGLPWEAQGHQGYDGSAWYRHVVRLRRKSHRLYLVGTGVDDRADVFFNGKRVGAVASPEQVFSFDITDLVRDGDNIVALRVEDIGGLGGLRGWMVVSTAGLQPAPMTVGQMRARLWSEVIHGASATVIGYTADESWGLLNPRLCSRDALKAIPFIKNNINALGEVVLPRPRIRGVAAVVWPQETLRARLPRSYREFLTGPATRDVMRWYLALLFSGVPTDVISTRQFIAGAGKKYRACFFPLAERVPKQLDQAMLDYLRAGGVVLLTCNSFSIDDDTGQPRQPPQWLGPRWKPQPLQKVVSLLQRSRPFACAPRYSDGATGVELTRAGGDVLFVRSDGKPWFIKQKIRPGYLFFSAVWPDFYTASFVARLVCSQAGIRVPVQIDRERFPYVETHLLGRAPRWVVYLCNWGAGEGTTRVRLLDFPAGTYRVRPVPLDPTHPVKARQLTASQLERGIKVRLESQNPVVILIEKTAVQPLTIPHLPSWQRQALEKLWVRRRPKPSDKFILCDAGHYARVHPARMPTATALLENNGFYLVPTVQDITGEVLKGYDACFMLYRRIPVKDSELQGLRQFVQAGGGLLVCATADINWHNGNGEVEKIASLFGLHVQRGARFIFADPDAYRRHGTYFTEFTAIEPHELTRGVKKFVAHRPQMVAEPKTDGAVAVIRPSREVAGLRAPVMVACEYGRGRVVLMGDVNWLLPQNLSRGDNQRLLLNIARWLTGRSQHHGIPRLPTIPAPSRGPAGYEDPIVDVAQ